jgi:hypothetical protein
VDVKESLQPIADRRCAPVSGAKPCVTDGRRRQHAAPGRRVAAPSHC